MSWKQSLVAYFNFTRRERIAVICLILLITAVFLLPGMVPGRPGSKSSNAPDTSWINAVKKLEAGEEENKKTYDRTSGHNIPRYDNERSRKPAPTLFFFDPNKLSAEGWKQLGLRDKTITTIQKYLGKGGKFKEPQDLARIYGLFPDEFERIAPYIRIEPGTVGGTHDDHRENKLSFNPATRTTRPGLSVIDINLADTTAFIALPAIGSKLANRIINFRDKLGGFYSVDQVAETFGLPDSVFQKIRPFLKLENAVVQKLNINMATLEELKGHPYIRYALANAIISYRNQHGPFATIADIKNIMSITTAVYEKLVSYLSIQ